MSFRLLSRRLQPGQRRVYRAALIGFCLIAIGLVWPIVTFSARVQPFVLGMPFSLFYIATLLVASFLILLALFIWENRTGSRTDGGEDAH